MKKLLLLLAVFCLFLVGCEKGEGIYNPTKKISRISVQDQDAAKKQVVSKWTWDKNLLKKIQYYWNGEIGFFENYTYDKNKLIKVEDDEGWFWKISYKNNLYDIVEYYTPFGDIIMDAKFSYENKKISKVVLSYYSEEEVEEIIAKCSKGGFMSHLFPSDFFKNFKKVAAKSKGRVVDFSVNITFTYEKNNIKERVISFSEEIDEEKYSYKLIYSFEKYDNYSNPFYHFYSQFTGEELVLSKNNPVALTVKFEETYNDMIYSESYTIEYEYLYDGKFPSKVVQTERGSGYYDKFSIFYDYQE